MFSHWEVFDLDPFWVPTTEEEIAHFGEKVSVKKSLSLYQYLTKLSTKELYCKTIRKMSMSVYLLQVRYDFEMEFSYSG